MNNLSEHLNQPDGNAVKDIILLLVLFVTLFMGGLGSAPLIDPDEGRYAEIPREMLEKRDFVTPTLNYVKYFEKPPLLYWVNAGSMQLLGQNEFAARFPSALSGVLTVLLTYIAGRIIFERKTALIAALILGSSAGFMIQSRIILTDMLLTLCLTGALFSFMLADRSKDRNRRLFFLLFFICSGLAVLAKGLIGFVLPGGIIFWYLLLARRWSILTEIPWVTGLFLFSVITVPWFVLVSLANPEFPHFFFIHEHFQRFTSTIHQRSQPFWFFFPVLLLIMFPWSFYLPGSLANAWRQRRASYGSTFFLLLWPLVIILFFSLSSSKLIPYILPAMPPLALLLASRFKINRHSRRPDYITAQLILAIIMILAGSVTILLPICKPLITFLQSTGHVGNELAMMLSGPLPVITIKHTLLPGAVFLFTGILLIWLVRIRSGLILIGLLCFFGILLEIVLSMGFTNYMAERLSSRSLARALMQHAAEDTVIAQSGPRQGMNFYTGKRLITVGNPDELAFGSRQGDQQNWFLSHEQFFVQWLTGRHAMIVVPKAEAVLYGVSISGIKPRILADNGSLLLISNY